MAAKARLKQLLVAVHLYLGLALSLFFAAWFVSGIAMMYYYTPIVQPRARQAVAEPIPWAGVRLGLDEASRRAGWPDDHIMEARIGALLGRPVLRVWPKGGNWRAVFLDDGEPVTVGPDQALALAAGAYGGAWSVLDMQGPADWGQHMAIRPYGPALRLSDGKRELLVAQSTGDPILLKREGFEILFWLGPVLHYFNQQVIRDRPLLWNSLVNWSSFLGGILCLTGLTVGVWVLRWGSLRKPAGKAVPYREPWMWYHHVLGLFFGLVTFTWVVSGLFSMNPLRIFPGTSMGEQAEPFAGGPLRMKNLQGLRALAARRPLAKEAFATNFGGTWHLKLWQEGGKNEVWKRHADGWEPAPWLEERALERAVGRALPGFAVSRLETLEQGDSYYYERPRKEKFRPFPVYRVDLQGPQALTLYVEPRTGEVFLRHSAGSKLRRWLYNGLHSFDFQPLIRRPWWDILVIALSLAGAALSGTGVALSWRWLRKKFIPGTKRTFRRTA